MRPGELRAALATVWCVLGVVFLGILLVPWLITPAQVASIVPVCEWQAKYHKPCPFCGMTTAFFAISQGEFGEAEQSNRGSLVLFSSLVVNELALAWFLGRRKPCSAL